MSSRASVTGEDAPWPPADVDALVTQLVGLHGEQVAPTAEQWRVFLTDPDGGPVQMVYLVAFRERALYPDGGEPERTGAEAFFLAGQSLAEVIAYVGGQPLLGGFVRSVMVDDDGEDWDYVGAARYPSRAAFVRLWLDERTVAAGRHRAAGTRRHRLHVTRPL
jgi:hypothetical protein